MTAAVVQTACSNRPRRWRPPSSLAATSCVFELIETTTSALVVKRKPYVNADAARHREALRRAKVLTASDPTTLEIRSGDFFQDFEAESRLACLQNKKAIRSFEERQTKHAEGQNDRESRRKEPALDAWSPDAAKLSEAAAAVASRPGGGGVGPRVTLDDAYRSFRTLKLADRSITAVDPAFAHFESLTELDLGRNRLQVLGNLPTALVTLSCAANELSGRALEGIAELPRLSSLDLSYNSLDVDSLLSPKPKAPRRRRPLASSSSNSNIAEPPQAPTENGSEKDVPRRAHRAGAGGLETSLSQRSLDFHRKFAVLEHLDLSWNCLCDLGQLLRILSPLQDNLRHLFLAGNPICLLPAYRERVLGGKACGPRLLVLDDLPVTVTERRSAAESLMAALAINVEQDEPSLVEARDAVHDEGEAHGEGDVKGEGRRLRVRGPLDVVHFGVKLLRLTRLPDIGLIAAESARAEGSFKESATPSDLEGGEEAVAAAGMVGETSIDGGEGNGAVELPNQTQWGVLEYLVPGDNSDDTDDNQGNNRSDGDTSSITNARSGTFVWASEVTPPESTAPVTNRAHDADHGADHSEPSKDAVALPVETGGEESGGSRTPWELFLPVVPSKMMRDEMQFGGLCVLLFMVEEGDEMRDAAEAAATKQPGHQNAHGGTASSMAAGDASNRSGERFEKHGGDAPVADTKDNNVDGDAEVPAALGSAEPQARLRRGRRRRLVGRGCLSISTFLDPAWMAREQQRVQQHRQQMRQLEQQRREEQLEGGVNPTVVPDSQNGDGDRDVVDAGGDIGGDGQDGAAVTVSGSCDIVFEPWVVEGLQTGAARRKKEREEQEEAARVEAEERAANEPKGKKGAKAAAVVAAKGQAAGEDQGIEEREGGNIESWSSAIAEVEVTLNSDALLRRFAAVGGRSAGTRTNDARVATDAW